MSREETFGSISLILNILGCTWGFQLCNHRHYGSADADDSYGSGGGGGREV